MSRFAPVSLIWPAKTAHLEGVSASDGQHNGVELVVLHQAERWPQHAGPWLLHQHILLLCKNTTITLLICLLEFLCAALLFNPLALQAFQLSVRRTHLASK